MKTRNEEVDGYCEVECHMVKNESKCPSDLESLVANIALVLPQENCGRCGYETCIELARAVAMGVEAEDACKVAGEDALRIISCIKKLEIMCNEVTGLD